MKALFAALLLMSFSVQAAEVADAKSAELRWGKSKDALTSGDKAKMKALIDNLLAEDVAPVVQETTQSSKSGK